MQRPRPALAALATVVAVAVGITAGALTIHRPTSAAGGPVRTTRTVDTPRPPATTSPRSGHRTDGAQPTLQRPPTSPRISDPALAARQVFKAWQAGDRQRALQAATPAAVRTLFGFEPSQAKELRFTGCHPGTPGYDCFYLSTNVGLY